MSPTAAVVSFRLGGTDGVAIEATKWTWALRQLGFSVVMVAGEGTADVIDPALAMSPSASVEENSAVSRVFLHRTREVVGGADVVVVENLASLPFNPTAIDAIAALRLARPTVFHHHDLGWQREQFREWAGPPTGDAWAHVTINDLSREELRTHGIEATTMRNRFAIDARGDRNAGRRVANVDADDRLVLQPTRAIARKNVPAALALAEQLGATFWIPGDAEEGYGPTLDALVAEHSRTRVVRGGLAGQGISIDDAYQASDLVAFPSTWEGFGNATIESAVHRKPLAIGDYPVARELRAYGFEWFDHSDVPSIEAFLDEPDHHLLDHNAAIAGEHFDLAGLPAEITALIERAGWRL